MKVTKLDLAKILAEMSWKRYSIGFSWDKLPYHKQLSYIAEAERFIKAVKILKKKNTFCQSAQSLPMPTIRD